MTKRDYDLIAACIHTALSKDENMLDIMCRTFKTDNPKFSASKFMEACIPEGFAEKHATPVGEWGTEHIGVKPGDKLEVRGISPEWDQIHTVDMVEPEELWGTMRIRVLREDGACIWLDSSEGNEWRKVREARPGEEWGHEWKHLKEGDTIEIRNWSEHTGVCRVVEVELPTYTGVCPILTSASEYWPEIDKGVEWRTVYEAEAPKPTTGEWTTTIEGLEVGDRIEVSGDSFDFLNTVHTIKELDLTDANAPICTTKGAWPSLERGAKWRKLG
jgi:hypothetical protein